MYELSGTRMRFERAVVGNRHGMRGGGSVVRLCAHRHVRDWLAVGHSGLTQVPNLRNSNHKAIECGYVY